MNDRPPASTAVATHIGIATVSAEGAALCYRTICTKAAAIFGRHGHPQLTMHTYPLVDYMGHIGVGRWSEVGTMLLSSADRLRRAGAQLLVCPDNTAHQGLDLVRDQPPLLWPHIAEVAARHRFRRELILGTRYLTEGPVYPVKLDAVGIGHAIPDSPTRARVNALTLDELVYGRFEAATRAYFVDVIEQFKQRGS